MKENTEDSNYIIAELEVGWLVCLYFLNGERIEILVCQRQWSQITNGKREGNGLTGIKWSGD